MLSYCKDLKCVNMYIGVWLLVFVIHATYKEIQSTSYIRNLISITVLVRLSIFK